MSTFSRRTFSLSAVGLLSGGLLAACGTESDEVEPTVTRVDAEGAPPTFTPTAASVAGSPAASPVGSTEGTPEPPPSDGGPLPNDQEGGITGEGQSGGVAQVTILYRDFAFDPPEVTVAAGTEITFNFENVGAAPHAYKIDEVGLESATINSGQTDTLTFTFEPGTYQPYCPVPGHKELGMVGTLIAQ